MLIDMKLEPETKNSIEGGNRLFSNHQVERLAVPRLELKRKDNMCAKKGCATISFVFLPPSHHTPLSTVYIQRNLVPFILLLVALSQSPIPFPFF